MTATSDQESFADFTERGYARALELAARSYRFARFTELGDDRHVLWRHDLDFSVHRGVRLAELEKEAGATATYFVYLHSQFYNPLSSLIAPLVERILALDHDFGLHFDPTFYAGNSGAGRFAQHLAEEARVLEQTFGVRPVAVSFHLFGVLEKKPPDDDELAGMVNAYGRTIRERYEYCSDSNGVWRHRRLHDVLAEAASPRLHVLTHPEWWTPEPMAPRARIQRCLDGQAAGVALYYDDLIAQYGRPNVS